jgi:hypothetical protein
MKESTDLHPAADPFARPAERVTLVGRDGEPFQVRFARALPPPSPTIMQMVKDLADRHNKWRRK